MPNGPDNSGTGATWEPDDATLVGIVVAFAVVVAAVTTGVAVHIVKKGKRSRVIPLHVGGGGGGGASGGGGGSGSGGTTVSGPPARS